MGRDHGVDRRAVIAGLALAAAVPGLAQAGGRGNGGGNGGGGNRGGNGGQRGGSGGQRGGGRERPAGAAVDEAPLSGRDFGMARARAGGDNRAPGAWEANGKTPFDPEAARRAEGFALPERSGTSALRPFLRRLFAPE